MTPSLLQTPDQYLNMDGLNIRYCIQGEGEPLVLIHGLGAMIEYWYRNIPSWSQHYRVIAFDLPGFGKSDKPFASYSTDYYIEFLIKFLGALHIETPRIIAHSLGGALALRYAIEHTTAIKKLVLLDNVGFATQLTLGFRLLTVPILRNLLMRFTKATYSANLRTHVYDKHSLSDDFIDCAYHIAKSPDAKRVLLKILHDNAGLWGIKAQAIAPILENAEKINKLNMMIFWGIQDPILHYHPHTDMARRLLPNIPLVPLAQCGHIPQIEQSAIINQAVIDFLKEK